MRNADGTVKWATDPKEFLTRELPELIEGYKNLMRENDFDPQKVGKSSMAYEFVLNAMELAYLRSK